MILNRLIIFILLFTISFGQTSVILSYDNNDKTIENLKKENKELKRRLIQLEKEKQELLNILKKTNRFIYEIQRLSIFLKTYSLKTKDNLKPFLKKIKKTINIIVNKKNLIDKKYKKECSELAEELSNVHMNE